MKQTLQHPLADLAARDGSDAPERRGQRQRERCGSAEAEETLRSCESKPETERDARHCCGQTQRERETEEVGGIEGGRERERGREALRETHAGYWFLLSMTNLVAVKPSEPLFHTHSQPQETRDAPLRNTHQ